MITLANAGDRKYAQPAAPVSPLANINGVPENYSGPVYGNTAQAFPGVARPDPYTTAAPRGAFGITLDQGAQVTPESRFNRSNPTFGGELGTNAPATGYTAGGPFGVGTETPKSFSQMTAREQQLVEQFKNEFGYDPVSYQGFRTDGPQNLPYSNNKMVRIGPSMARTKEGLTPDGGFFIVDPSKVTNDPRYGLVTSGDNVGWAGEKVSERNRAFLTAAAVAASLGYAAYGAGAFSAAGTTADSVAAGTAGGFGGASVAGTGSVGGGFGGGIAGGYAGVNAGAGGFGGAGFGDGAGASLEGAYGDAAFNGSSGWQSIAEAARQAGTGEAAKSGWQQITELARAERVALDAQSAQQIYEAARTGGPSAAKALYDQFVKGAGAVAGSTDWGSLIGGIAGALASNSANRRAEETQREANELARRAADLEQQRFNLQKEDYEKFIPVRDAVIADSLTAGSAEKQEAAAGRAAADVRSAYTREQEANRRQLNNAGINVASPRYQSIERQSLLSQALADAGGQTNARTTEEQIGRDTRYKVAALQKGIDVSGLNTSAQTLSNVAANQSVAANQRATAIGGLTRGVVGGVQGWFNNNNQQQQSAPGYYSGGTNDYPTDASGRGLYAKGGMVRHRGRRLCYAAGGMIEGPGTATSDSVPAMIAPPQSPPQLPASAGTVPDSPASGGILAAEPARLSDGEFVVRAQATQQYGPELMEEVNQGTAVIIPSAVIAQQRPRQLAMAA